MATKKSTAGATLGRAKRAAATAAPKKRSGVKKTAAPAKKATTRTAAATKRAPRAASRTREPDALALLRQDHEEVAGLFARFEKTGPRAAKTRQDLVERIIAALSKHAAVEEQIFYPAVRAEVPNTEDQMLEALEEHHIVKWTLSELERMEPTAERYGAKVTVLIESVRHHVEEEEELFARIRKAMTPERLRELGREMAAAKRAASERPHPEAPDTPPGGLVAELVTAPFDAAAAVSKATARRVRDIVT